MVARDPSHWPDRTPRRGKDEVGDVGGVGPGGQAARHSEPYLDAPQQVFGSTPAGAVVANSHGGNWVALPKNPVKSAPFTARDQRKR
jgi:hypothetical protein